MMVNVLKRHANKYQNVAIVDGADIVFQANPFDLMHENPDADLFFFGDRGDVLGEGERYFKKRAKSIGLGYSNEEFLQKVQAAFYNKEKEYSVYANGGAFFGTFQAVLDIQRQMIQISSASRFWHSDQGQMNIARYLYGEKHGMEKVVCYPDMTRSIVLGNNQNYDLFSKEGLVTNEAGLPFIFVHQYDKSRRRQKITNTIEKLIQGKIPKPS